ncbi:MAG TPA: quinone oxidoreductase [Acidimicrobiia bacterium]|nr:quinone oxidoreductase [Acidimicrobiia bacterium]
MKAIVIHETGPPDVLSHEDVTEPSPGDGQILVDVEAAGLNFIDTYHRSGLYPMDLPLIPGLEGAGTVVTVGTGVTGFAVGDRVAWSNALGSYSERHVVAESSAVPIPDGVDTKIAAAVILQGLTAHYLVMDTYPLQSGDTCLIHAGAGGVGLLLTQIAAMRGARVVTTVGTEEKAGLSRAAGADEVVVYTGHDFRDAVAELIGEHSIDVVYDGVGQATFDQSIDLLRPRGMMVTYGNSSGPVPPISPLTLTQKGSLFLTRPTMAHYLRTRDELLGRAEDLFGWISEGRIDVRIGAEYPLTEAADAHRALEARQTTGKVLILP